MTQPEGQRGTVINTLMDGTGRGLQNVTVTIKLIAPGNPFLVNGIGEVVAQFPADTDHTGQWSADLLLNSEYEQEGNYYLADERCAPNGFAWPFRITAAGETHWLNELLIPVPPPGVNPPWTLALDDLSDVDTSGAIPGDRLALGQAGQWIAVREPGIGLTKNFTTAVTPWVFNHGLGRRTFPSLMDSNGRMFFAPLEWPDDDTVIAYLGTAMTGTMEVP